MTDQRPPLTSAPTQALQRAVADAWGLRLPQPLDRAAVEAAWRAGAELKTWVERPLGMPSWTLAEALWAHPEVQHSGPLGQAVFQHLQAHRPTLDRLLMALLLQTRRSAQFATTPSTPAVVQAWAKMDALLEEGLPLMGPVAPRRTTAPTFLQLQLVNADTSWLHALLRQGRAPAAEAVWQRFLAHSQCAPVLDHYEAQGQSVVRYLIDCAETPHQRWPEGQLRRWWPSVVPAPIPDRSTLIHHAVAHSNVEAMMCLIEQGYPCDQADERGEAPWELMLSMASKPRAAWVPLMAAGVLQGQRGAQRQARVDHIVALGAHEAVWDQVNAQSQALALQWAMPESAPASRRPRF